MQMYATRSIDFTFAHGSGSIDRAHKHQCDIAAVWEIFGIKNRVYLYSGGPKLYIYAYKSYN